MRNTYSFNYDIGIELQFHEHDPLLGLVNMLLQNKLAITYFKTSTNNFLAQSYINPKGRHKLVVNI